MKIEKLCLIILLIIVVFVVAWVIINMTKNKEICEPSLRNDRSGFGRYTLKDVNTILGNTFLFRMYDNIYDEELIFKGKSDLTHFHIGYLYVVEECDISGYKYYKIRQNWED